MNQRSDGEKPRVKEWLYRKIFNEEYNIGFGYPRSDTCGKCDMLKVASDNAKTEEERSEIQAELASHHEKAAQGLQTMIPYLPPYFFQGLLCLTERSPCFPSKH